MKVPLMANSYGASRSGTVEIITNRKKYSVPYPFQPYLITTKKGAEDFNVLSHSKLNEMIRLPNNTKEILAKIEMQTDMEVRSMALQLKKRGFPSNRLRYIEQLMIDKEDWLLQFPNELKVSIMYFDIEVQSNGDGMFPTADKNPIAVIGAAYQDEEPVLFKCNDKYNDKTLLLEFIDYVRKKDPDIICTFNGKKFDLPYVHRRCILNDLHGEVDGLCRFKKRIYSDAMDKLTIKGRVEFDLFEHVIRDQTLYGIKSFGLKDVAKFKKIQGVIDLEEHIGNIKSIVFTKMLDEYILADINITRQLGKMYLPNCITLAEWMKVPLDSVVNAYPSFIPKIFCGRAYNKLNIISLDSNTDKYDEVEGNLFKIGSKFEGATVLCRKPNTRFEKIWKVDFKSMYPSSILTWNLGPDTTRILQLKDKSPSLKFTNRKEWLWLSYPDENFDKSVVIRIDLKKRGFLGDAINKLFEERKKLKAMMNDARDPSVKEGLNGRQWAIKVLLNSIYGMMGLKSTMYGDMATAMTVTATCRWATGKVMDMLGDTVVEVDTDGLMVDVKPDVEKLNRDLTKIIKDTFGLKSYMTLELEEFDQCYMYKSKNYVMREKGEIIKHGVTFKSSRHPAIYDRALERIIGECLDGNDIDNDVFKKEILNLDSYEKKDFLYRIRLKKSPGTYTNPTVIQNVLGMQAKRRTGATPVVGDQIEYYITKNPPDIYEYLQILLERSNKGSVKSKYYTISSLVDNKEQLDYVHYHEEIQKALQIFGLNTKDVVNQYDKETDETDPF